MDPISRKLALDDAQKGFHWRDGLFFAKTDQGNVRISKVEYLGNDITGLSRQFIIPINEWDSIVTGLASGKGDIVKETLIAIVPPEAKEITNDTSAQSTQSESSGS